MPSSCDNRKKILHFSIQTLYLIYSGACAHSYTHCSSAAAASVFTLTLRYSSALHIYISIRTCLYSWARVRFIWRGKVKRILNLGAGCIRENFRVHCTRSRYGCCAVTTLKEREKTFIGLRDVDLTRAAGIQSEEEGPDVEQACGADRWFFREYSSAIFTFLNVRDANADAPSVLTYYVRALRGFLVHWNCRRGVYFILIYIINQLSRWKFVFL